MSVDNYINLLGDKGDPLERVIVLSRDKLHNVLDPYSGIWGDHIFGRRLQGNQAQVDSDWMDFAGSHYTALVRVYQAHLKLESIERLVRVLSDGDNKAITLIELHDATAGFWEHIGSSIDNLCACWMDAPPLQVERAKETIVAVDGSRLDWMYDRRSQFIHSRIVPNGVIDGAPFFNIRHFDKKNTDWKSKYVQDELVGDTYPNLWKEFIGLMGVQWEKLRSRLRDRDKRAPKIDATKKKSSFDVSKLKISDIQIPGGPVPPSTTEWDYLDIPPSGTQ